MSTNNASLQDLLSESLPAAGKASFRYYHISTPPTRCAALFSPLPGRKPERTYRESHFLQFIILPGPTEDTGEEVPLFAIEVLIYTTAHLTTLFVSKADSTGLGALLDPKRTTNASPLRAIASTFISWLVRHRHRPDRKLVVSLFARAQDQYLFPGSVDHGKKHVLDDRGLVKWWCRTLDPMLREFGAEDQGKETIIEATEISSKGYVVVPGHDPHETSAFFPHTSRSDLASHKKWTNGHPLRQLVNDAYAPPRCLIPHFPDDPKARYLLELDEEVLEIPNTIHNSPSKKRMGQWRSIRTLEQFWEMMAFRQECSSGRLVGFIWIVFSPPERSDIPATSCIDTPASTPVALQERAHKQQKPERKHLTGLIHSRAPRIKHANSLSTGAKMQPEKTAHYYWPIQGRGTLVLDQKAYTRITESLLRLDYSSVTKAVYSTSTWIHEASVIAGSDEEWGINVFGRKKEIPSTNAIGVENGVSVNILAVKRRSHTGEDGAQENGKIDQQLRPATTAYVGELTSRSNTPEDGVNTLNGMLLRRKPKVT